MRKISVIGHFANGLEYLDGQTIKTKTLTNGICKKFGEKEVLKFDTYGGIKTIMKAPLYVVSALKKSKNVIILPAQNGLRIFGRLLPLFKSLFKDRRIHYVVIGGWLPKELETKRGLAIALKMFDGIYVETDMMKQALEVQGFKNIYVMPNYKDLTHISISELVYQNEIPYKLCTFSRVMKEKGIEDAIDAVERINRSFGKTIYTLDIYGQVDSSQLRWFDMLRNKLPQYITYRGMIPFDKSVETLKNYFALLFPTYYDGEGFAGTILDAMAAGVPVIASDWKYNREIINKDIGYLFEPQNVDELVDVLKKVISSIEEFNKKKIKCIKRSKEYNSEDILGILFDKLG